MNVGGHRITNDELELAIGRLGFTPVGTYQASGNVLLTLDRDAEPDAVAGTVEEGLAQALGYEVPTFVRSAAAVRRAAELRPFPDEAEVGVKPQVVFCRGPISSDAGAAITDLEGRDRLAIDGAEIHWLPPGGISDSALDLGLVERLVGSMTVRTRGTVARLAGKLVAE